VLRRISERNQRVEYVIVGNNCARNVEITLKESFFEGFFPNGGLVEISF